MTLAKWLHEAEAVCAKATRGPWRADWRGTNHYEVTSSGDPYWIIHPEGGSDRGEDLDFIAFARTALPLALKMIRGTLEVTGMDRVLYFPSGAAVAITRADPIATMQAMLDAGEMPKEAGDNPKDS